MPPAGVVWRGLGGSDLSDAPSPSSTSAVVAGLGVRTYRAAQPTGAKPDACFSIFAEEERNALPVLVLSYPWLAFQIFVCRKMSGVSVRPSPTPSPTTPSPT